MGYYTAHELEVIEGDVTVEEFFDAIRRQYGENEDIFYAMDDEGNCSDICKWYSSVEDMKKYSLMFPDAVFCLYGDGEESDDLWRQYYKNGKVQHEAVVMTFAPYDESKLE